MKTAKRSLALTVAMLAGATIVAAQGDVPITTTSKEALQLYMRAQDKAENIETEAAAGLVEQAIVKDPAFAMAYLLRAQVGGGFTVARENRDKAVSLADKVSPGEKHWILAAKEQADGNVVAAKQHLDALLAAFPGDKRVQSLVGFHHRGVLGDNKTAAAYFKKATQIDPAYAPAYNNLGYAQSAIGDYAGAEASFKKYISLLPDRPNPYDSYAELLMKMGRYDESIVQYKAALAKDAAFTGSLAGIGTNLVFKKDYDGGRSWYQQQLAKSPDVDAKLDAMDNIAISYVHQGDTAQALKTLDEIATLALTNNLVTRAIGAHYDAAFVLIESGQADQAEPHVAKAVALVADASLPPSVKARGAVSSGIMRARILGALGKFAEAKAMVGQAEDAAEKRPTPADERRVNRARGILAIEQQQYAAALESLAKSDPADPYTIYLQAVASEKAGRSAEAAALFKKVAQWNENSLAYATIRGRAMTKAGS
jgi:tetratricopeptide (TPR) repeat protein